MTANCASGSEVLVQCLTEVRVDAVVDDDACALTRGQAAQVGQALLCDENVDVVLCVVDVADHRHNAGDCPGLSNGFGHKDRQVSVPCEVTRAADAVHHPRAADMSGVDVAVDVEFQCGIDTDDAQATNHFRVVGDLLGTQYQFVFIAFQVTEHVRIAAAGQGDGAP